MKIISAISNDNPYLYYLNQTTVQAQTTNTNTIAILEYFFSNSECKGYNTAIEKAVNSIISNLHLDAVKDEYEREKLIHDALSRQVTYDEEALKTTDEKHIASAHSIVGVFIHKKAVCEGIAKAVKILFNTANINCLLVSGKAKFEAHGGHAWNIVRINKNAYHLDATWDIANSSRTSICYDYFNLNQDAIQRDHSDFRGIPLCNHYEENYFVRNGLLFNNSKDALRFAEKNINAKHTGVYLRLDDNSIDMNTFVKKIVDSGLSSLSADGYNWRAEYSVNHEQRTVRISFQIRV